MSLSRVKWFLTKYSKQIDLNLRWIFRFLFGLLIFVLFITIDHIYILGLFLSLIFCHGYTMWRIDEASSDWQGMRVIKSWVYAWLKTKGIKSEPFFTYSNRKQTLLKTNFRKKLWSTQIKNLLLIFRKSNKLNSSIQCKTIEFSL